MMAPIDTTTTSTTTTELEHVTSQEIRKMETAAKIHRDDVKQYAALGAAVVGALGALAIILFGPPELRPQAMTCFTGITGALVGYAVGKG